MPMIIKIKSPIQATSFTEVGENRHSLALLRVVGSCGRRRFLLAVVVVFFVVAVVVVFFAIYNSEMVPDTLMANSTILRRIFQGKTAPGTIS